MDACHRPIVMKPTIYNDGMIGDVGLKILMAAEDWRLRKNDIKRDWKDGYLRTDLFAVLTRENLAVSF